MKNALLKLISVSLIALVTIPQSHAELNLGTQPLYLGASIPPLGHARHVQGSAVVQEGLQRLFGP
jgi:hypothetical protein